MYIKIVNLEQSRGRFCKSAHRKASNSTQIFGISLYSDRKKQLFNLQPLWDVKLMLKCQIKTVVAFIFMKSNFPENFSPFDLVGAVIPWTHDWPHCVHGLYDDYALV